MAIDRIPGVGPQNSDIAAAVAAPSSSTIATAVAAAVPTLTQINNSVATNAPSPYNWVFLGAGNLQNVTAATVSFSAYRKLRIVVKFVTNSSTPSVPGFRFNGDTSQNYNMRNVIYNLNTVWISNIPNHINSSVGWFNDANNVSQSQYCTGIIEVENAHLSNPKQMTLQRFVYVDGPGNLRPVEGTGTYMGGAPITSFTIQAFSAIVPFANDSYNSTGFLVYGAN